jgi:flagellar basal body-associated protein FliL
MKHIADKPSSILIAVQRFLAGILVLIILVVLIGTMFAFIAKPKKELKKSNVDQQAAAQPNDRIFTGIGRIRAKSAEPQAAAVMITIAFPYNPDDTIFSEELASKVAQFRSETNRYFQLYTTEELRLKTDEDLQEELLACYNALLRLGLIDSLYITDYIIIE